MQSIDVAVAVVRRGQKILICQRKNNGSLGGFWEFPGGKREPGESLECCLARELMEEVAITVRIVQNLTPIHHRYIPTPVTLHPFLCDHQSGEATPVECQRLQWVDVEQFRDFKFPPANCPLLEEIAVKMLNR